MNQNKNRRGRDDFPLGDLCFVSTRAIQPGETLEMFDPAGAPHGEPVGRASHFMVRPMCFAKFPERVEDWEINSLKVAGCECLQQMPCPMADLKMPDGELPWVHGFPTQTPGRRISIAVTNISGAPKFFACTMIGRFAVTKGSLGAAGQAKLDELNRFDP